ncbi:MAG: ABC transporter substrate-binding protein, partial [Chloroflexi bacterium]|nr:ABC transporter substrate-binding protein [Chloroflexota bacterium]
KVVEKVVETGIRNIPRERTLVIYFGGSGGTWTNAGIGSPYATGYTHQNGDSATIEGLEYYSAFANEFWPWTAESHEYNSDGTELTIKIRKGVEWSDGVPFTAKDVAFTLNGLIAQAPALRNSAYVKEWVKEAKAVDDYTVKVTFNKPNWRFYFEYLTFKFDTGIYIVPEHIYKDQADWTKFLNFDVDKGWPVTTAPYRYTYWTNMQKFEDRRDDWWAAKIGFAKLPKVERILCLPMVDDTKAAQLSINNSLDACLDLRPNIIKTILEQNPNVIAHTGKKKPYGYVDWWPNNMGFNDLEPPYNNPDIRWAVSYAIDRDQAIQVAYDGAGTPNKLFLPDPSVYKGLKPFMDAIEDLFEQYPTNKYDPAKSAELLEKNGYKKNKDGFWEKDGQVLTLNVGGWQIYADIGPVIAEQLRKNGFNADFSMPSDYSTRIGEGRVNGFLNGHGGSVGPDPYFSCDLYNAKRVMPTGQSGWGSVWRWKNEAYTAIVDEMGTVPIGDPRVKELFRKAMEIWLKELPSVPLIQWYHRIPMNLTYWKGWPWEEDPYLNGAFWHLTFPRIIDRLEPVK